MVNRIPQSDPEFFAFLAIWIDKPITNKRVYDAATISTSEESCQLTLAAWELLYQCVLPFDLLPTRLVDRPTSRPTCRPHCFSNLDGIFYRLRRNWLLEILGQVVFPRPIKGALAFQEKLPRGCLRDLDTPHMLVFPIRSFLVKMHASYEDILFAFQPNKGKIPNRILMLVLKADTCKKSTIFIVVFGL
ncbi:hypothetical protein SAMN05444166_0201 [Singulisphaera sp. GP187]|nr:hypothetical protein SAMN05444166_0201 [Singulisphaera sp. GP187]